MMASDKLKSDLIQPVIEEILDTSITKMEPMKLAKTNLVYKVETKEGKFIVKIIYRPPVVEEADPRLVRMKDLLRLLKPTGIPIPDVIYTDAIERKIFDHTTYGIGIRPYVVGKTLDQIWKELDIDERTTIATQLGKICRTVHDIEADCYGFLATTPQVEPQPTWKQQILLEIKTYRDIIIDHPQIDFEMVKHAVDTIYDSTEIWSRGVTSPHLIHNDLWNGNVIVNKIEGKWTVTCLIDWEWTLGADPIYEFAYFNSPYLHRLFENDNTMDVFYNAYGINMYIPTNQYKQYIYQIVQAMLFLANIVRNENDTLAIMSQMERIRYALIKLEEFDRDSLLATIREDNDYH